MEHRVGQRKPVQLSVKLDSRQGAELQGEILNLSARGAFIRLPADRSALHNIVRLRFLVQPPKEEYCVCWALIVRNEADGIGVMFDQRQEFALAQFNPSPRPQRNEQCAAELETYKAADRAVQQEPAIS